MGKALVVYESMWGNTEKVARAVAEGLATALQVEVCEVRDAPGSPAADVDLIVVGGPTHAFSMTRATTREDARRQGADHGGETGLREWLDGLPDGEHDQHVATFDTRVERMRHLPGSAAKSAARVVHRRGYRRAEGSESFYVTGIDGPLVDGEPERASAWGRRIAASVSST
jgi:flavodoxin